MDNFTRNELVHKVREYIPNENIRFTRNKNTGNLELYFVNKKSTISLPTNDSWEEIKRHINSILCKEKSPDCSICSASFKSLRRVSCNKCAKDWCVNCYVNIFRTNKGLIKCPFCRHTFGTIFEDWAIELAVQEILNK